MKNNIFIFGASGLLGRSIFKIFNLEYKVYGTYNFNNFKNLINFNYYKQKVVELKEFFVIQKINIIVNCIAERNVDICEKDWNISKKLNIEFLEDLIKICEELNVKLVHISTDYIYDGNNPPYSNISIPNPIQNYGISKLIGEYRIKNILNNFIIIRVPVLYSNEQKCLLESSPFQNIKLALDLSLNNKKIDNYNIRFPTNTEDVALFLLNHIDDIGCFNFSSINGLTKYDIIIKSCNILKLNYERFIPYNDKCKYRPVNTCFEYIFDCKYNFENDLFNILKTKYHDTFNPKEFLFLLDLDGTLLDTDIIHYDAYKKTFLELNIDIEFTEEIFFNLINHNNINIFLKENLDVKIISDAKKIKKQNMLENTKINTIYNSEIFIDFLIKNNYNYCVVTNTNNEIVEHYKKYNSTFSKIKNIITREDYINPKPNKECWDTALEKYYKGEKYIIGIENTSAGYESLKNITNYIYILKSIPINYDMDTYLFDNYKQILREK